MSTLQKWGALSALMGAVTYIFGFALLSTLLAPSGYGMDGEDPAKIVAFIVENQGLMSLWNLSIYVVNGIFLAVLAVAFADRFKPHAPALAQVGLIFGTIWATLIIGAGMVANVGNAAVAARYAADPESAVFLWEIVSTVELGLGGGNEIVGGVWALVLGIAMLKTGLLPRLLGLFSLLIGLAGLSTILPFTGEVAGAVFGLGYIVWFVWVAVVFLRNRT